MSNFCYWNRRLLRGSGQYCIGRVKFGLPLDQVCKNDIPGPLLVLILKLNKEAPYKKDVFRAPGHQANMKKLIHFLQNGRLVNLDNFSIYTIASVLKKFLRKLPDGIFGAENERLLFDLIELQDSDQQRDDVHRLITSLPVYTQHLLVLLFGTFRVIATNAERSRTGMTSEAIGVSVAPSFFQSCVSSGREARQEDVARFKVATRVMRFLIDNFGVSNLFGRENYEYYARITGRILKVEEDWIFSFRYPPDNVISRMRALDAQRQWIAQEMGHWGLRLNLEAMSAQEECQSTPALLQLTDSPDSTAHNLHNTTSIPENTLAESDPRLSVSLEDTGLFKVHERQAARMRTRSEWFMTPVQLAARRSAAAGDQETGVLRTESLTNTPVRPAPAVTSHSLPPSTGGAGGGGERPDPRRLVRRSSSKDKDRRLVRRSSSKKDKENGAKLRASLAAAGEARRSLGELEAGGGASRGGSEASRRSLGDLESSCALLSYKPRI